MEKCGIPMATGCLAGRSVVFPMRFHLQAKVGRFILDG